jgi:AGCS family alanine or glycine:cation symporter
VAVWVLRIVIVLSVFYGSMKSAKAAWDLGDIGVGAMAWINIIAILLLSQKAIRTFRDYEKQQKEGKDPFFDPKKLDIDNADFWEERGSDQGPGVSD